MSRVRSPKFYDVGVLGLCKMGKELALKMAEKGHYVVVYDPVLSESLAFSVKEVKNKAFAERIDRAESVGAVLDKLQPGIRKIVISLKEGTAEFQQSLRLVLGDSIVDFGQCEDVEEDRLKVFAEKHLYDNGNAKGALLKFVPGNLTTELDGALRKCRSYKVMEKGTSGGPLSKLLVIASKINTTGWLTKAQRGLENSETVQGLQQLAAGTEGAVAQLTVDINKISNESAFSTVKVNKLKSDLVEKEKLAIRQLLGTFKKESKGIIAEANRAFRDFRSIMQLLFEKFGHSMDHYVEFFDLHSAMLMELVAVEGNADDMPLIGDSRWMDEGDEGVALRRSLGSLCAQLMSDYLKTKGVYIGSVTGKDREPMFQKCVLDHLPQLKERKSTLFFDGVVITLDYDKFSRNGYRSFAKMLYGSEGGFKTTMFTGSGFGRELLHLVLVMKEEKGKAVPDSVAEEEFLGEQFTAFLKLDKACMALLGALFRENIQDPPEEGQSLALGGAGSGDDAGDATDSDHGPAG